MSERVSAAPTALFLFTEVHKPGGIQRFNQTLLEACKHLGIRGTVLSLKDPVDAIGSEALPFRGFSGSRPRFAIAVAAALLRSRHDRVVIGHINFLTLVTVLILLRPAIRNRTILAAHGIEVWQGIGLVRQLALNVVGRVLCVSSYTRSRIMQQAPRLDGARLTLFPNAVAQSWEQVESEGASRRKQSNFILSVARLERGDRYKGIATVIEAFSMLCDRTLQYFVIGRGNDTAFLKRIATRCGVQDRVHFLGGIPDQELLALYRNCRVFVLPSGKEGFGIVFLEAMLFSAPVIAAREKGAVDVVVDGETGLTVDFGDIIALTGAIERILEDDELCERLRRQGHATVVGDGDFTFARFTKRCAEVFGVGEFRAAS